MLWVGLFRYKNGITKMLSDSVIPESQYIKYFPLLHHLNHPAAIIRMIFPVIHCIGADRTHFKYTR